MNIFQLFHRPISLPRVTQETDSHCGPAVIQALLGHLNTPVTQDQVVTAAKVRSRIQQHGTRPDQLAKAVNVLAPDLQFWVKQRTTPQDLHRLVREYRWPVAINWQGLFYDTIEEEREKHTGDDRGHYSIVIDVDIDRDKIVIADPYGEYSRRPRTFSLNWFQERWWDMDKFVDRRTKKKLTLKTNRLIFCVTPKDAEFPKHVGMKFPTPLKSA